MIKTTELMLGNLVDYLGEYMKVTAIHTVGIDVTDSKGECWEVFDCSISPIPLTEGVLKRLEMLGLNDFNADKYPNHDIDYVHKLQIHFYLNPIDITPLLSPRYTTHDGVDVWEGDLVYYTIINSYINPQQTIVSKSNMDKIGYIFFSTLEACQSYIDSVTRKPVFTTEDGVDVFEGGKYWCVARNGYTSFGGKDIPTCCDCVMGSGKSPKCAYFSTKELAQAYLNKVWAEKEYNDLLNANRK